MPESAKTFPKVSIVTPSYNQGEFIEKTILSVLRQDYPNVEYIVMDAQSKDHTSIILDKYRSQIAHIVQEKDEGQADAIDKGFKLSTGEIMAYLNSDDCYAAAEVISCAVKAFENNPDIDVVYGKRQLINKDGSYLDSHPFQEYNEDTLRWACFVPQECVFWRRSAYERAGNMVDKTFTFAMDYDLWFRFMESGAKWMAIDEEFGLFRFYPDQKTNAIWIERGLPEIARIHLKYMGKTIAEKPMIALEGSHHYGVHPHDHHPSFAAGKYTWDIYRDFRREIFESYLLDDWCIGLRDSLIETPRVVPVVADLDQMQKGLDAL
jgi:glycosyltransferase involved in cell wall biosynthesis